MIMAGFRRGAARRDQGEPRMMPKHAMLISDSNVVRGRIEWDDDTGGEIPLLIIDGNPITWKQLGRMLMTYEGFNFKLEIFDPFESR